MAISMSLKLTPTSKRYMQKFPVLFKKGFYKGMQESIRIAEREARKNAPVLTGTLRRSIQSEVERQSDGDIAGFLFSHLIYSGVIELGFAERNIAAQPYLEPAIKDNLERFEDRIENAITKAVLSVRS